MRHRKINNNFDRTAAHRDAMFRNMATSLLKHEKIRTTLPKAKALRPIAEGLITLGKKAHALGDSDEQPIKAKRLHLRRQALRVIREKQVVAKVFDEIAPRYAERKGGYTRVLKLGKRPGDDAEQALVELVEAELPKAQPKAGGAKRKKAAAKPRSKPQRQAKPKPQEAAEAAQGEQAAAEPEPEEQG